MYITIEKVENGYIFHADNDEKYIASSDEDVFHLLNTFLFSSEDQDLPDIPF